MGVKHFFSWFKNNFPAHVLEMTKDSSDECISNYIKESNETVDNFMIDMNGIFHNSAQKIFRYGDYKSMFKNTNSFVKDRNLCYDDVCKTIEELVSLIKPTKRLILCIDGTAPLSKQIQQRQRRFVSAKNRKIDEFDSCSITPGTVFMDRLSSYIDRFIKNKQNTDEYWRTFEIVFSNEKVPGEGEQKIFSYIKKYCDLNETYCLHGMDADLIMISLISNIKKLYILRDCSYKHTDVWKYFIDVKKVREEMVDKLKFEHKDFNEDNTIRDFVFMCFMLGNDFLPNIPCIEIIQDGIEFITDTYTKYGVIYGHLTNMKNSCFNKDFLCKILETLSTYETYSLENKLKNKDKYFLDEILEECSVCDNSGKDGVEYKIDIDSYRKKYYNKKLPELDMTTETDQKKICTEYMHGLQWILHYYTNNISDWKWKYNYHYAPFSHTLCKYVKDYEFSHIRNGNPTEPFLQLLCVLPISSSHLVPKYMGTVFSPESKLSVYYPKKFDIDLSGKRQEWEGIALLPMVDYTLIEHEYKKNLKYLTDIDKQRNMFKKTIVYKYDKNYTKHIKTSKGDIFTNTKIFYVDIY